MIHARWTARQEARVLVVLALSLVSSVGFAQERRFSGEFPRAPDPTGKKYALLVGIQEYQHSWLPNLHYAESDVLELGDLLRKQGYEVVALCQQAGKRNQLYSPTCTNIEYQLKTILNRCRKGDVFLFAFSGHGVQFHSLRGAYLCPSDARPFADRTETLISLSGLYRQMEHSFASSKLMLLDVSRSLPVPTRTVRPLDVSDVPRPPRGVAALFSCASGETSRESPRLRHGLFFHHVMEAMAGKARNGEGVVTWDSLRAYVKRHVARHVSRRPGRKWVQRPVGLGDIPGEPVVLLRPRPAVVNTPRIIVNSIGMKLVRVPAGQFTMGSPRTERGRKADETLHQVRITRPHYMGVHEVTQEQYEKLMRTNPSCFCPRGSQKDKVKGMDTKQFPVENVNWFDAMHFCKRLSILPAERRAGRVYSLPTEEEWEYACRAAGASKTVFHCGDVMSSLLANVDGRFPYGAVRRAVPLNRPTRVGSYRPNALGLYDMHGNVFEWCADVYSPYPGDTAAAKSRRTTDRILRGGAWNTQPDLCRAAARTKATPTTRSAGYGFRVICRVEEKR